MKTPDEKAPGEITTIKQTRKRKNDMNDKDFTTIKTKLKTANVKYNANRKWAHRCAECYTLTEYPTFEEAAHASNCHSDLHTYFTPESTGYGPAPLWPSRESDQYGVIA